MLFPNPTTDALLGGDTYSLVLGVTGQEYLAEVVYACVSNGCESVFITRDHLPLFLERHRDKTMILYGAASVLTAFGNTYNDPLGFHEQVEARRIVDIEVGHRLESLATLGTSDTEWNTLYDCYRYYHRGDMNYSEICNRTSLAGSILLGYEALAGTEDTVPSDAASRLTHATRLILSTHEAIQARNQTTLKQLHRGQPFGYVSAEYLEAMQSQYGIWAECLTLMSSLICREVTINGIGIDVRRAEVLRKRYQSALAQLEEQLREYGYTPGHGSTKQLQAILSEIEASCGVRFERNMDGNILTNANALNRYADCSPFIPVYLKAAWLRSRLSNYLVKMTCPRLHPEYNYLLQTGRVSNGGDLATQTIPRDGGIRECIIPTPGHVFICVDVCQMELLMLSQAMISQFGYESKLVEMINTGGNIHRKVAAMMFDKAEDEVTDEERSQAKILNFGIPGGMGAKGLCAAAKNGFGMDWDENMAEQMRRRWLALFPEVNAFLEEHHGEGAGVLTLTGRYRAKTERTQNRNTIFQGLGADAMVLAVWNLLPRSSYKVVNLVHDEVLIEVPMCDDYTEVVADIEGLIIDGLKQVVPDMDVRVESVVSTCWSKKAEKVYDDDDRLVAWFPEQKDATTRPQRKIRQLAKVSR